MDFLNYLPEKVEYSLLLTLDVVNLYTKLNEINNLNPSIQFTINKNKSSMPFLNVLVIKSGTRITTDIYSKPTDTYNYLNFRSCHRKHTKLNILNIITIVREETLQERRLSELRNHLREQNYPKEITTYGISKAKSKGPIKPEEINKNQNK